MNESKNTLPIIDARNTSKIFNVPTPGFEREYIAAVDQVSLQIYDKPAQIISLVGESGSGKTTLARMILGLTSPTLGEILYKGKRIEKLRKDEWWDFRRNVQPVFQDPFGIYNPFYRVDRPLDMTIKNFGLASTKKESYDLKAEALRAVDLRPDDVIGRYPHQLSGGQCQRVMLARTLLLRPKIIVADEPVSMIDVACRMLILNTLLDFRDNYHITTLMITHDLATAHYVGGPMFVLCFGRAVESGDIEQLLENPSHPYTQQLLKAIPNPDPTQRWETRANVKVTDRPLTHEGNKCVYVARCPHAMDICSQQRPPDFQIAKGHYAACFLYRDHPIPGAGGSNEA